MESKPSRRRGAVIPWVIGVVTAGGLAVGITSVMNRDASVATGELTSDKAVVKKINFEVATTGNGELEAREKIEIRNPLDQESTIVEIIPEGQWATKGDLLIQLNADTIQQKVDEETLRVESARANLVAAENNYTIQLNENTSKLRQAGLKVELAELALRQWREGDVRKKRQELELAIDKASLELDRLAQKLVRSTDLLREGFLSKDEADRDEVAYIEAISQYTTALVAKQVYDEYEYIKAEKSNLSDLEEARAEIERVRLNNDSELASKDAKRANERSSLTIMENRLTKLRTDKNAATMRAPSDGLVVYASSMERNMWGRGGGDGPLQIGQQVWPNQLLIVLPNTAEMIASVRVPESLAGKVRPGQKVTVKVDAASGQVFPGEVESIGIMAESGGWRDPNLREYSVRVAINKGDAALKPAMRCEARLVLDQVQGALAVPVQAVFSEGPVQYVYEPKGGKFARTPVRVGRRSDSFAEIARGLEEGRVVLIREPAPGEVIAGPWDTKALEALGYSLDAEGRPLAERSAPPPVMPAGEKKAGGERPRGDAKGGGGGAPKDK